MKPGSDLAADQLRVAPRAGRGLKPLAQAMSGPWDVAPARGRGLKLDRARREP